MSSCLSPAHHDLHHDRLQDARATKAPGPPPRLPPTTRRCRHYTATPVAQHQHARPKQATAGPGRGVPDPPPPTPPDNLPMSTAASPTRGRAATDQGHCLGTRTPANRRTHYIRSWQKRPTAPRRARPLPSPVRRRRRPADATTTSTRVRCLGAPTPAISPTSRPYTKRDAARKSSQNTNRPRHRLRHRPHCH